MNAPPVMRHWRRVCACGHRWLQHEPDDLPEEAPRCLAPGCQDRRGRASTCETYPLWAHEMAQWLAGVPPWMRAALLGEPVGDPAPQAAPVRGR